MQQAVDLYTSFREKRPTKLARLKVDVPKVVACMGHVEAIDYRTTHGGKVTLYRHKFEKGSRPLLCVSGNGKQLMLLGGHYEWTDRGIQDEDADGNLIDNPKHGKTINPRRKPVRDPEHKKLLKELSRHFASDEAALRKNPDASKWIGVSRHSGKTFYVSDKRGKTEDWGYTNRRDGALILSRRLAAIFINEGVPGRYIQNVDTHEIEGNPKSRTPHHICPICNREGGSHVPEALRRLGMPGEYAHPRCVQKSIAVQKGFAPSGAVVKNRAYYFETHDDARQYAINHGLPTERIIPYSSGWAIQIGARGRSTHKKRVLAGNPRQADSDDYKHFEAWAEGRRIPLKTRQQIWALFKSDPDYWSDKGWTGVERAVLLGAKPI